MERAPGRYQGALKAGLGQLGQAKDDHGVLGSFTVTDQYGGCVVNPLVSDLVDEPLYVRLLALGLQRDDAHHLMYAVHNRYQWFATLDGDFWKHRTNLEEACGLRIRIRQPAELVAELAAVLAGCGGVGAP
jgi:hypothetical protein